MKNGRKNDSLNDASLFLDTFNQNGTQKMVLNDQYTVTENLSKTKKRKFSEVYRCKSTISNDYYVLKQLQKTEYNTMEQERLRQEATFSFDYEGLPKVLDFFEDDFSIKLLKKHEQGIPINEFLAPYSQKKRRRVLGEIMLELSDLFHFIHEQGILHLDVKPSNILVELINKNYRVSLIDFGLALRTSTYDDRKTLFPLGFAAPELILNELAICNKTTDYYSLGITLWNCLTNRLPLAHPNPSIFTNLQLNHPLPESTMIPRKYHMLLEKLCAKYTFEVPANQFKKEAVITRLQHAQNKRYQELRDFTNDWIKLTQNSWWRS